MVLLRQGLAPITNPLNSVLIEKKLENIDQKFLQLVSLAEGLPRTEVLESSKNYWRGICRSLIFRFPDDLEILKLEGRNYLDRSKGIIQIRSAARLGVSDLGVNLGRVEYLFNKLENL
tara:strand:+ start:170 stop:523 length:354 start_codon:yes stop_codon:yes gene_type:complete